MMVEGGWGERGGGWWGAHGRPLFPVEDSQPGVLRVGDEDRDLLRQQGEVEAEVGGLRNTWGERKGWG